MPTKRPPRWKVFGVDAPLAMIETRAYREWVAEQRALRLQVKRQEIIGPLIERDGAFCGLCKGEIKHISAIDVDHIVPISRGGSSALDNLQVAHSWCNRSKGNRMPGEDGYPWPEHDS